jgi:hypothetical protein
MSDPKLRCVFPRSLHPDQWVSCARRLGWEPVLPPPSNVEEAHGPRFPRDFVVQGDGGLERSSGDDRGNKAKYSRG